MEERDYSLLPEAAWNKLTAWYGLSQGSRPINRYTRPSILPGLHELLVSVCVCVCVQEGGGARSIHEALQGGGVSAGVQAVPAPTVE